jgi:hypothetical protein
MLERTIPAVRRFLEGQGLGWLFARVRRIYVVRQESYHDEDKLTIGLRPADARKPVSAFHTMAYLLLHEFGHQFALDCLTRGEGRKLAPLFGDCWAPYERSPTPRTLDPDFVSRYAMRHPLEDFAETFAVCLWRRWHPDRAGALIAARSPRCRRKIATMGRLIDRNARHGRRAFPGGSPCC